MLSIDNTYDEQQLREFDARVRRGLESDNYRYVCDPKIDGVAVSIRYEEGRFVRAVTRGDGVTGDVITHSVRPIRSVPLKLGGTGWPPVLEVRGEICWPLEDFRRFNAQRKAAGESAFANPRNATAGTLKQLDPAKTADRQLLFVAHGFGEIDPQPAETQSELFELFADWRIPVSPFLTTVEDIDAVIAHCRDWDARRRELPYETDGVVIKVNSFAQRDILGATSRYPRWCIAYKYPTEQAVSKLLRVEFQVGKLGTITPRAVMEPVQVAGTTVRHATLHNFDQVERLDVRVGDTIVVEKAGEIIPQVVQVVKEKRPSDTEPITRPDKCPACGQPTEQVEGGVYLRCTNRKCEAQLLERLEHFCGRNQMDIDGMGEALIEQLVDKGLVKDVADIYELPEKRDRLLELERMGKKSVDNLIAAIEETKERPLSRLLAALNIRLVGASTAELLAEEFGNMDALAAAGEEQLTAIEGIGPEVARSIHDWFTQEDNLLRIERLKQAGVNTTQPKEQGEKSDLLAGRTVVVTGTLENFSRKQAEDLIKSLGGKVSGSVSKKTSFVVCGQDPGSKLEKARKAGVEVLSEEEFLERIGEGE